MIVRPDHGSKGRACCACTQRLSLTVIEKGVADAVPSVRGQQHAFAEIEQRGGIDPAQLERRAEFILLGRHRAGRGRADDLRVCERRNQHRIARGDKRREVIRFVGGVAIVKIGVSGEDRDPQRGQIGNRAVQFGAGQRSDRHAQAPTCAHQSARL